MTGTDPSASLAPPSYKTLKLVVIVLGILLVVGFATLVATIVYRVASLGDEENPVSAGTAAAGAGAMAPSAVTIPDFGTLDIERPGGAELVGYDYDNGILSLHFRDSDGNDQLIFMDPVSGRQLGTVVISKP